ncbi:Protein DEK [Acipenser ruthenus]|uniref:Protein DEK n=1 Tax=Acipenser ruthenus TaxID=7906 RepID=A0A662YQ01_ACIRT|nr:Protein DEK [Acipenser ruthenus]
MSGDGDTSLNTDTEEKNNEEATKKPASLPATEKEIEREEASEGEDEEEEDDGKGKGEILGNIERIQLVVGKMKAANLKPLHKLLYNRPGTISSLKKNIRRFSGFTFEEESDQYKKKREILKRYTNAVLKTICGTLDLEKSGKNDDLISRIMTFLMKPKSSGKPLPRSKRKSQKAEKRKRKNTGSAKKAKSKGTTSAEILTESSSEEEEKDSKQSSGVDDQLSENTDEPKRKPQKGGKKECSSAGSAKKKSKPKASMSALVLESSSEEEEGKDLSSEEDEPPKKVVKTEISVAKGKTQSTKLANVKKADSSQDSTKREQSTAKQENDSDDEPLIKMLKKPPTDNNLRDTLKKLLENANLEEVTMKQICKKVYENYPDHDLTDRKDYIKKTVKEGRSRPEPSPLVLDQAWYRTKHGTTVGNRFGDFALSRYGTGMELGDAGSVQYRFSALVPDSYGAVPSLELERSVWYWYDALAPGWYGTEF